MTEHFGGLAATGSDVTPWLIVAGIIVLLGVIALIIAGIVRSRRAERQVEDAAAAVADAGGTLPEPDPDASDSAETVIQEATELGAKDAGTLPPAPLPARDTPPPGDSVDPDDTGAAEDTPKP
ncbi:hypothetical protein GCM10028798_17870 [Humibacter antri]